MALVWNTRSCSPGASSGRANSAPSAAATAARSGSTSTRVTSTPGIRASSRATQQPSGAGADDGDPVADERAGVPERVDRGLDDAGQDRPGAGTSSGTTVTAAAGTTYAVWCGCRQKTVRPDAARRGPPRRRRR